MQKTAGVTTGIDQVYQFLRAVWPFGPAPLPGAPAAEIGLDPRCSATLDRVTRTLEMGNRLASDLGSRVALLEAASAGARGARPNAKGTRGSQARAVSTLTALLRRDDRALRLVSSIAERYRQALQILRKAEECLGVGDVDTISIETLRGQLYFLSRIGIFCRDVPDVARLFQNPGESQTPCGSYARKRDAGRPLLRKLQLKMTILEHALNRMGSRPGRPLPQLPWPAEATVESLARTLAADAKARSMAMETLTHYRAALRVLELPGAGGNRGGAEMVFLASLPASVRTYPALARLFPEPREA